MGDNAGRLDVLTRQTPARRPAAGASASELTWDQMLHRAQVLANSGMVRTAYAKKPEAIMYAGAKGAELGWSLVASLDFIDPIEGRAEVNAQGRLALIRQAGHEAEVVEEQCDETRAVVRGRRRGTEEWHYVTWTIEEADRAGLTAEWVEKWQETQSGKKYPVKVPLKREGDTYVPAKFGQTVLPDWAKKAITEGQVKRNDGWWNYPGDKLVARAASRLCRRHFSEVLIGRGLSLHTAEEQGYETSSDLDETAAEGVIVARVIEDDQDDDVVDGEIVEQGEDVVVPGHATVAPPGPGTEADDEELAAYIRWKRAGKPRDENGFIVDVPPTEEPERGQDNAVAEVVEPQTAPAPSGPVPGEWRARAVEQGKGDALLLKKAREFAAERGVEGTALPRTLDQVTDPADIARLEDWIG